MALTHECPHPNCTIRVRYNQLACYAHWRIIPKPLRDELNRTWHSGGGKPWLAARKACTDFLEQDANT